MKKYLAIIPLLAMVLTDAILPRAKNLRLTRRFAFNRSRLRIGRRVV
jgi:hypothetical protein